GPYRLLGGRKYDIQRPRNALEIFQCWFKLQPILWGAAPRFLLVILVAMLSFVLIDRVYYGFVRICSPLAIPDSVLCAYRNVLEPIPVHAGPTETFPAKSLKVCQR